MTRSRQTADWGSRAGLAKVIPSSVAVGSGTGSADSTGKVTFTSASSISLNNCFSSTYDNYRVMININTNSADATVNLKMRKDGSDNSLYYSYGRIIVVRSGGSGTENGFDVTTGWAIGQVDGDAPAHFFSATLDIQSPYLSQYTTMNQVGSFISTSTQIYGTAGGGTHGQQIQFDGMSIIPTAGNITGTLFVYGYN